MDRGVGAGRAEGWTNQIHCLLATANSQLTQIYQGAETGTWLFNLTWRIFWMMTLIVPFVVPQMLRSSMKVLGWSWPFLTLTNQILCCFCSCNTDSQPSAWRWNTHSGDKLIQYSNSALWCDSVRSSMGCESLGACVSKKVVGLSPFGSSGVVGAAKVSHVMFCLEKAAICNWWFYFLQVIKYLTTLQRSGLIQLLYIFVKV